MRPPRRAANLALLVVPLALLAACSSGQEAPPASSAPPRSTIRVGLQEWKIVTPEVSVRPGRVVFIVTNAGSTRHNLDVRQAGEDLGHTALLDPGGHARLRVRVTGGEPLRLSCTVTGHAEAGMVTHLAVSR